MENMTFSSSSHFGKSSMAQNVISHSIFILTRIHWLCQSAFRLSSKQGFTPLEDRVHSRSELPVWCNRTEAQLIYCLWRCMSETQQPQHEIPDAFHGPAELHHLHSPRMNSVTSPQALFYTQNFASTVHVGQNVTNLKKTAE